MSILVNGMHINLNSQDINFNEIIDKIDNFDNVLNLTSKVSNLGLVIWVQKYAFWLFVSQFCAFLSVEKRTILQNIWNFKNKYIWGVISKFKENVCIFGEIIKRCFTRLPPFNLKNTIHPFFSQKWKLLTQYVNFDLLWANFDLIKLISIYGKMYFLVTLSLEW